ncbi:GNAT family N-acetyltransferase [Govanella unica]|uniref:GNAT family N-acetyltransferase n=1 Tax=Govanella unica TaxID=2975056 RepID=A0A9X3TZ53_9PROT|nr:GNAT family N-acetyltransferase [Govania unica]MDA5194600.1 GNAT family N-acetyltransferase [Govania unica]
MNKTRTKQYPAAVTETQELKTFQGSDLEDLCNATIEAIVDGEGFSWIKPPSMSALQAYWRGVLLIPERTLFVARLSGELVGTAQLIRPPSNNETGAFSVEVGTFFVAPWARGHGLARSLLADAEARARQDGFKSLEVNVRADREAAMSLAEGSGFTRWATKERYALIDGTYLPGHFYVKYLDQ